MSAAENRLRVIIDVDTGIDDALALMLATRLPGVELLGVTTVSGNVDVGKTTENTLRVLSAVGRQDIPVYRGMSAPLVRAHQHAAEFHAPNGLGGVDLPPSPAGVHSVSAPEFMLRTARGLGGELTLVCTGPLTNLAVALSLEPNLPRLIKHVVVMGGAFETAGNTTPYAEFNIFADPEAAAAVALSALPLTFVGLDVTHKVPFTREHWNALAGRSGTEPKLVHALLRHAFVARGRDVFPLHDPLTLGVAFRPDLVSTVRTRVSVQVGASPAAGQTSMSRVPAAPAHEVALEVDAEQFLGLFRRTLNLE